MNNNYKDKYDFIHDKPTIDGESSSGNPLIYSALYRAVSGIEYDYSDIFFTEMLNHTPLGNDIYIKRTPDNIKPTSLDEIIGAIYLGLIDDELMKAYNYRWHDTLHSPKWYRVLQAVIYCAGKHRNFFWESSVRDIHPLAYWIPWHIQYYLNRKLRYAPLFYLWLISVFIKRSYKNIPLQGEKWYKPRYKLKKHPNREKQTGAISQKNIAWLVIKGMNNPLHKLVNHKKHLSDYFSQEHPINKVLASGSVDR